MHRREGCFRLAPGSTKDEVPRTKRKAGRQPLSSLVLGPWSLVLPGAARPRAFPPPGLEVDGPGARRAARSRPGGPSPSPDRSTLMRFAMNLLVAGFVLAPLARADDPSKKPDAVVREIDLKGYPAAPPRGDVHKPVIITTAEELARAFVKPEWQDRVKKQVDFARDKLLFFAWSGSGGDRLMATASKGKDGPVIVFHYSAGLTDDVKAHFRLFALPRTATWRVEGK